jgi:histone H3/H4
MRGNGTAQYATNKDLVKEIAALKGQLKKLSAAMEAEAKDGVSGALSDIETKSREAIDSAIEAAQEFIDGYADSASEAASALAKKTVQLRDAATDSLVETVQARPLSTLAAVIGIGFVAGYLCRRN